MTSTEDRMTKFQRILPRLDLAPVEAGGPIVVTIDPPFTELCDVTLGSCTRAAAPTLSATYSYRQT